MKLQLVKAVPGTGRAGEIVEVTDAYARNYLLPKNLARVATATAIQVAATADQRHRDHQRQAAAERDRARAALSQVSVTVAGAASSSGRLFAAVHADQLRRQLEQQCAVRLPGVRFEPDHWKTTGRHAVQVHWPDGQVTDLAIEIVHG